MTLSSGVLWNKSELEKVSILGLPCVCSTSVPHPSKEGHRVNVLEHLSVRVLHRSAECEVGDLGAINRDEYSLWQRSRLLNQSELGVSLGFNAKEGGDGLNARGRGLGRRKRNGPRKSLRPWGRQARSTTQAPLVTLAKRTYTLNSVVLGCEIGQATAGSDRFWCGDGTLSKKKKKQKHSVFLAPPLSASHSIRTANC